MDARKLVSLLCIAFMVLTMLVPASVLAVDLTSSRLAGADRYQTAVSVAQAGWTTAENAVLAGGANGNLVDALAVAPLAKLLNAPILLTANDRLTPVTAAELQRLGVKTVYLAGGDGVIPAGVRSELSGLGIQLVALGGTDRFATAANIAAEVAKRKPVDTVVVTTAYSNADALSIASIAAANGWPILLTGPSTLPDYAASFVAGSGVVKTFVIGGILCKFLRQTFLALSLQKW